MSLSNSGKIFKMAFLICQTEDPSKDILSEGHLEDIRSKIRDNLHSLFFLEVLSIFLTLLHIPNSVILLINLELKKKKNYSGKLFTTRDYVPVYLLLFSTNSKIDFCWTF